MQSLIRFFQSAPLIGLIVFAGTQWVNPQPARSGSMETRATEISSPRHTSGVRSENRKGNSLVVQTFNFQPPDRGAPGNRADAGSRSPSKQPQECSKPDKPMTALIPRNNWGETLAAHPTFWLYLPTRPAAVELILRDEATEKVVYEVKFPVAQGPGIVSFPLPETAPPLEEGKAYRWMFNFFCSPEAIGASDTSDIPIDLTVSGIVARIAPPARLVRQLEKASPAEKIALYAENGLWYETLTELAELRRTQPRNAEVADQWMGLLKHQAVKLENIAQEPILSCCELDPRNSDSFSLKQKGAKSLDRQF